MNNTIEYQLENHKFSIFYTVGDSMEPLLQNQKTHVIVKKAGRELKKNDLPLYRRPNKKYVMHRIIKVDEDFYYTRGDNRLGLEKVPKDYVLGVVDKIYKNDKYISVGQKSYLFYVHFWNLIYPFRYVVYRARNKWGKYAKK